MKAAIGYLGKTCLVAVVSIEVGCVGYTVAQQLPDGMSAAATAPPELEWIAAKREKDLLEKGYMEDLLRPTRAEYLSGIIMQKRAAAMAKGGPIDDGELGFFSGADFDTVDISRLPFTPTKVPGHFIEPGSERYLIPGGQRIKQFYTKTAFGRLIAEELIVDEVKLDSPNLSVAGAPAKLVRIKHQGATWATVLYAQRAGRLFIIEADKNLEGKQQLEYIQFAETLLASADD